MSVLFIIIIIISLWIVIYMGFFRKRGKYNAKIMPFIGFGTRDSFKIAGRVILDRGDFISYSIREFKGKKFIRNYRRLRSIKVPNAKLEINFGFRKENVKTDQYGYYKLKMVLGNGNKLPIGTNKYSIRLVEEGYNSRETFGDLIIIPEDVDYGIICDIDDTILQSNVSKKIKLLLNTFMSNERDMKPIPGMNILINNLHIGPNKTNQNPVLYLTASPFDLIDKINSFLKTNFFPAGPIIMKKLRGEDKDKLFDSFNYKVKKLHEIFTKFPNMSFVLIGDNTEKDIEAFNLMNIQYNGRVKIILIMNVEEEKRDPIRYKSALLCNNSFDAAIECMKAGLISPMGASEVGEKLKDLNVLSPKYNVEDRIDNSLPFPVKEFRKLAKKSQKRKEKRKKLLRKLFGRSFFSD